MANKTMMSNVPAHLKDAMEEYRNDLVKYHQNKLKEMNEKGIFDAHTNEVRVQNMLRSALSKVDKAKLERVKEKLIQERETRDQLEREYNQRLKDPLNFLLNRAQSSCSTITHSRNKSDTGPYGFVAATKRSSYKVIKLRQGENYLDVAAGMIAEDFVPSKLPSKNPFISEDIEMIPVQVVKRDEKCLPIRSISSMDQPIVESRERFKANPSRKRNSHSSAAFYPSSRKQVFNRKNKSKTNGKTSANYKLQYPGTSQPTKTIIVKEHEEIGDNLEKPDEQNTDLEVPAVSQKIELVEAKNEEVLEESVTIKDVIPPIYYSISELMEKYVETKDPDMGYEIDQMSKNSVHRNRYLQYDGLVEAYESIAQTGDNLTERSRHVDLREERKVYDEMKAFQHQHFDYQLSLLHDPSVRSTSSFSDYICDRSMNDTSELLKFREEKEEKVDHLRDGHRPKIGVVKKSEEELMEERQRERIEKRVTEICVLIEKNVYFLCRSFEKRRVAIDVSEVNDDLNIQKAKDTLLIALRSFPSISNVRARRTWTKGAEILFLWSLDLNTPFLIHCDEHLKQLSRFYVRLYMQNEKALAELTKQFRDITEKKMLEKKDEDIIVNNIMSGMLPTPQEDEKLLKRWKSEVIDTMLPKIDSHHEWKRKSISESDPQSLRELKDHFLSNLSSFDNASDSDNHRFMIAQNKRFLYVVVNYLNYCSLAIQEQFRAYVRQEKIEYGVVLKTEQTTSHNTFAMSFNDGNLIDKLSLRFYANHLKSRNWVKSFEETSVRTPRDLYNNTVRPLNRYDQHRELYSRDGKRATSISQKEDDQSLVLISSESPSKQQHGESIIDSVKEELEKSSLEQPQSDVVIESPTLVKPMRLKKSNFIREKKSRMDELRSIHNIKLVDKAENEDDIIYDENGRVTNPITILNMLESVFDSLLLSVDYRISLMNKYSSDGPMKDITKIKRIYKNWKRAADAVVVRESILVELTELEKVISDPCRLFQGSSASRAAEERRRSTLFRRLCKHGKLCEEAAKILEKDLGDTLVYKNEEYLVKMQEDYTNLLCSLEGTKPVKGSETSLPTVYSPVLKRL